ncbi:hypothetical protein [Kitasatospora brasiliensis]|uniref:hypothetical protein n=1 Tax=Kitasatospora brasiliensis TaxID=3058040 RepID=UPI00292F1F72|nr:hypothetical protein [Kitasatospora sp. K002]
MPGTRHFGGGPTGRAVWWLVAALLVPALAACGGGSGNNGNGNGNGQTGNGQTGNGQTAGAQTTSPPPEEQRTEVRATDASFQEAGSVSAAGRGWGTRAVVTLKSSTPTPVQAVVSDVTDCTVNAVPATPSQATTTVTSSGSEPLAFALPTESEKNRPICYTVTIGGESRQLKAEGVVLSTTSPSPTAPITGATAPGTESTSPSESATPYQSGGVTGTASATSYQSGGGTGPESGSPH